MEKIMENLISVPIWAGEALIRTKNFFGKFQIFLMLDIIAAAILCNMTKNLILCSILFFKCFVLFWFCVCVFYLY